MTWEHVPLNVYANVKLENTISRYYIFFYYIKNYSKKIKPLTLNCILTHYQNITDIYFL